MQVSLHTKLKLHMASISSQNFPQKRLKTLPRFTGRISHSRKFVNRNKREDEQLEINFRALIICRKLQCFACAKSSSTKGTCAILSLVTCLSVSRLVPMAFYLVVARVAGEISRASIFASAFVQGREREWRSCERIGEKWS